MVVISIAIYVWGSSKRTQAGSSEVQQKNSWERLTLTTNWSSVIKMEDWQKWESTVTGGYAEEIDILDLDANEIHPLGPHQFLDVAAIKRFKIRANGEKFIRYPVTWKYRIF